jgi:hypothetical protein
MKFSGSGGANPDLFDVLRADFSVLAKYFLESIDRRVIAAAAGIRLKTDIERLEAFSELVG